MLLVSTSTWLWISLAVFLAFGLKAITGFGENLLMIPLISLFLPLTEVLPMTLVVVLIADGVLLYKVHADVVWWYWKRIAGMAIPGIIIGTLGLTAISPVMLKKVLGIGLMLYAIVSLMPIRTLLSNRVRPQMAYYTGLLGGSLSGMIGIGGPPVIAYMSTQQLSKAAFRATCIVIFLVFDLLRLGSYAYQDLFTVQTAFTGLTLIPAFLAGTAIGFWLHHYLPEKPFLWVVRGLLLLIGLSLLVK